MRVTGSRHQLDEALGGWRRDAETVALVPTMGNLHAGHLDLVDRARQLGDRVVVSIFVNPTQFGENEDLDSYPHTPEADRQVLEARGVDLVFAPDAATMYPGGLPATCRVEVPGLSDILCGASRPGHFTGVATVVAKLLNMVRPDIAVFGEKDYQQLVIIRRLVRELFFPVHIEGVRTHREPGGLALSSRNQYMSADEKARAAELYRTLCEVAEGLGSGTDATTLETRGLERLRRAGFEPEYLSVRRADDLQPPEPGDRDLVVLAAAWMGRARLIDNVRVAAAPKSPESRAEGV